MSSGLADSHSDDQMMGNVSSKFSKTSSNSKSSAENSSQSSSNGSNSRSDIATHLGSNMESSRASSVTKAHSIETPTASNIVDNAGEYSETASTPRGFPTASSISKIVSSKNSEVVTPKVIGSKNTAHTTMVVHRTPIGNKENQAPRRLNKSNPRRSPRNRLSGNCVCSLLKLCQHDNCFKAVRKSGLCKRHSGMKRKICHGNGCIRQVVQFGLCVVHGAKKDRCSIVTCTKKASDGGLCKSHHAFRTSLADAPDLDYLGFGLSDDFVLASADPSNTFVLAGSLSFWRL